MLHPSAALPYEGRSRVEGRGALRWMRLCLLLGESRHRGCLRNQSKNRRKLRTNEAVQRGGGPMLGFFFMEFFPLISQWGYIVSDIKASVWSCFQPPCAFFQQQWHQVLGCGPLTATPPHKKALRSLKMIINSVNYSYALAHSC